MNQYYQGRNIISAICNLVKNPITKLSTHYMGTNRANNSGDALEYYVQDLFAGSFGMNEKERKERLSEVFSYLGNSHNPPDAMLKGGDAIEVKKLENEKAELALNSSYPKQTLKANNPMISQACIDAENWKEKDILYIVGYVGKRTNVLNSLCMVYGLDYCASENCYKKIKETIKKGVNSIPGIEFAPTNELGLIKKIDPLGITYLRVRGMWGISNPWCVFSYIYNKNPNKKFNFMCIIGLDKWNSFENRNDLEELGRLTPNLFITDEKVNNPDNPAKFNQVKLISFSC